MLRPLRLAAQGALLALFGAVVGFFSDHPAYVHQDPELALIKLSFRHAGDHVAECRRLTPEEIAALPPNMRRPTDCPRQRVPLLVELVLDDRVLYRDWLAPSGLAGDGASSVYQRFPVPAGPHRLVARLRDSRRAEGFDFEAAADLDLAPQQNFVVDFRGEAGGFIFM